MAWTIVTNTTLCAFRLLLDGDPFSQLRGMDYTPGPVEAFFAFMLAYLLFMMLLLLMLPKKWSGPIFQIAFHPKGETK